MDVVPKGAEFEWKGKRYRVEKDTDPFLLLGYLAFED